jgi:hypothetical protein
MNRGMRGMRHIVIVISLAAAGCGGLPYSQLRAQLSPLEGQPLAAATARLGPPSDEKTEFGRRIVLWKKNWTLDSEGDDQECVIQAYMKGDTIGEIHFAGDETQCYRFAETLAKR